MLLSATIVHEAGSLGLARSNAPRAQLGNTRMKRARAYARRVQADTRHEKLVFEQVARLVETERITRCIRQEIRVKLAMAKLVDEVQATQGRQQNVGQPLVAASFSGTSHCLSQSPRLIIVVFASTGRLIR